MQGFEGIMFRGIQTAKNKNKRKSRNEDEPHSRFDKKIRRSAAAAPHFPRAYAATDPGKYTRTPLLRGTGKKEKPHIGHRYRS